MLNEYVEFEDIISNRRASSTLRLGVKDVSEVLEKTMSELLTPRPTPSTVLKIP